jgi:hypothetical protein
MSKGVSSLIAGKTKLPARRGRGFVWLVRTFSCLAPVQVEEVPGVEADLVAVRRNTPSARLSVENLLVAALEVLLRLRLVALQTVELVDIAVAALRLSSPLSKTTTFRFNYSPPLARVSSAIASRKAPKRVTVDLTSVELPILFLP